MYGSTFKGNADAVQPLKLGTTVTKFLKGNQIKVSLDSNKKVSIGMEVNFGRWQ